ncbi:MAG: gamma-glutamylcyclotransferase [Sulfurimonas sp.]|jgi:gamma-glutamylcyclotransferase (GGCT)/AIG2-like uncharacterized protein YtfP|uniref:gamma-glutamylcyclotransferase n=1 Tax=Sulfurimonas sp. TaxID=2022749 RepID=UPI0035634DB1
MPSPTSEKKVVVLYGDLRLAAKKAVLKEKYKVTCLAESLTIPGYKLLKNDEGTVIAVAGAATDTIVADVVRFGPKGMAYLTELESLEDTLFTDQNITVNGETMAVTFPLGVASASYTQSIPSGDYLIDGGDEDDDDEDDAEEIDSDEDDDSDEEAVEVEDVDTADIHEVIEEVLEAMEDEEDSDFRKLHDVLDVDLFTGITQTITHRVAAALETKFIIKKSVD